MSEKNSLKKVICYTLALVMMLSFMSVNVFAEDTKVVTVTKTQSITAPSSEIGKIMDSISKSTSYYDDGAYKGTLRYSGVSGWKETVFAQYPNMTLYQYTFDVIYTGTVTKYLLADTKAVTVTKTQNITVPSSEIGKIMDSISKSTSYYDDGIYKGTLSYSGVSGWKETIFAQYPNLIIYQYTFNVIYTGTVTKYV